MGLPGCMARETRCVIPPKLSPARQGNGPEGAGRHARPAAEAARGMHSRLLTAVYDHESAVDAGSTGRAGQTGATCGAADMRDGCRLKLLGDLHRADPSARDGIPPYGIQIIAWRGAVVKLPDPEDGVE